MAFPETPQQFYDAFGEIAAAGYRDRVFLSDTTIGFSVQKEYPDNIRYKPAKTISGIVDNVAVIWVVYEAIRKAQDGDRVPIRFRIGTLSKYRAKHWDYNFDDAECPTEESIKASLSTPQPMQLDWVDEIFCSSTGGGLVNADGEVVDGVAVLNKLFEHHCNSVHLLKGLPLRSKQQAHKLLSWTINKIIETPIWILKAFFGRTLDEDLNRITYLQGYLPQDFKKLSVDAIEVAGYRASKRVIVLFALIVVLLCWYLLPPKEGSYLASVIDSEFLLAVHSLLLLIFLDEVLPSLMFRFVNFMIGLRKTYFNFQLKRR